MRLSSFRKKLLLRAVGRLRGSGFICLRRVAGLSFSSLYTLPAYVLFRVQVRTSFLYQGERRVVSFLRAVAHFVLIVLGMFCHCVVQLVFSYLV